MVPATVREGAAILIEGEQEIKIENKGERIKRAQKWEEKKRGKKGREERGNRVIFVKKSKQAHAPQQSARKPVLPIFLKG